MSSFFFDANSVERQHSEQVHGKRKVAQLKRQQFISLDSQNKIMIKISCLLNRPDKTLNIAKNIKSDSRRKLFDFNVIFWFWMLEQQVLTSILMLINFLSQFFAFLCVERAWNCRETGVKRAWNGRETGVKRISIFLHFSLLFAVHGNSKVLSPTIHVQQNILEKSLIEVPSSYLHASFGTFYVQIVRGTVSLWKYLKTVKSLLLKENDVNFEFFRMFLKSLTVSRIIDQFGRKGAKRSVKM